MKKTKLGLKFWLVRIFFALAFVLVSFWLIISSMGLRIDWSRGKLIRTGLIKMTIQPADAIVFFDGKRIARGSKVRITNIAPGGHEIKIEKAGYLAWEQSVFVQPGEAILFDDIKLFLAHPRALSPNELQIPFQPLESPEDIKIEAGEIFASTGAKPKQWELVTRLSSPLISAYWFPGKAQILFQSQGKLFVMDKNGSNIQELVELPDNSPAQVMLTDQGKKLFWRVSDQPPKGIVIRR